MGHTERGLPAAFTLDVEPIAPVNAIQLATL